MRYPTLLAAAALLVPSVLLGTSAPCAKPARPKPADAAAASAMTAAEQLHALFAETWEAWMADEPTWASELGDHRYDELWPSRTLASFAAREARAASFLARARAIPPESLTEQDRLSRALYLQTLADSSEENSFGGYLLDMNHMGGPQTLGDLTSTLRFETLADYEGWLARLRNLPAHLEEITALLREGMRRGITQPRVIMDRVPEQLAALAVEDATTSPFYNPCENFPDALTPAERERIAAEMKKLISTVVLPAYGRFAGFFSTEYLPACRESIGASSLPRGLEFYAARARRHTTTTMTPQEIHDIGLAEVKRIRAEMQAIIVKVGFEGDFAAFLKHLRTDPKFFAKDGAELLRIYRDVSKRIDPEIVRLFGRLPRMPYGVRPIPDEIAPDTTTAYYNGPAADGSRAGTYWVNLYRPEVRPLYEIEALSLHEAVPGHHLQIALAQELGELPQFRRHAHFTAYIEGWGLYAESLGDELGMYQDPYSKFGQLTYEMWRAVRLVVDTGMHALGWERQRAIDFFKENAAKSEHDIVNEIDRYIAWPGQALAYKVGELKIKELRARATRELGERFDIRAFHDVVLGSGAVPLTVLEQQVDAWIASQKTSK